LDAAENLCEKQIYIDDIHRYFQHMEAYRDTIFRRFIWQSRSLLALLPILLFLAMWRVLD